MMTSTTKYWHAQLDEESVVQPGGELTLPHDRWPKHVFIVIGIRGTLDALVEGKVFEIRAQTQLVLVPGTPCRLVARGEGAIELISLLSMPPGVTG
jgi:hypothetical protein